MTDSASSLGDFLRQERERVAMTLEQVASATKINIRLLHALESDQYDDLPAKPFIRGYVIAYCRFIGIDPKEVLTQFGQFIDVKTDQRSPKRASVGHYVFERRDGDQMKTWLTAILVTALVILGVIGVIMKPKRPKHHRQIEKLKSSASPAASVSSAPSAVSEGIPSPSATVSESPSPISTPIASPKPSPSASPSTSPSPSPSVSRKADPMNAGADLLNSEIKHRILIKAEEDVFIRFIVDKKQPNRFVLKKGKMMTLKAAERIFLQLSDVEAGTVSINGTPAKSMLEVAGVKVFDGITTIGLPVQIMETKENPFKGLRALPKLEKAEEEAETPTSAPAESLATPAPSPTP